MVESRGGWGSRGGRGVRGGGSLGVGDQGVGEVQGWWGPGAVGVRGRGWMGGGQGGRSVWVRSPGVVGSRG